MRLALITDLHLGLDATCVYYNRLLGPQAEPIATAALQTLNQSGADLTIIQAACRTLAEPKSTGC